MMNNCFFPIFVNDLWTLFVRGLNLSPLPPHKIKTVGLSYINIICNHLFNFSI